MNNKTINPGIFRAYDVRGIFPDELNEKAVYRIGCALILFLKSNIFEREPRSRTSSLRSKQVLCKVDQNPASSIQVVVGRDCRLSSPKIFKAFADGIISQGANVIDIGLVPTDAIYFALNFLNADGAAMITASHNPPNYNGIKMVTRGPKYICGDWGIPEIKKLALKNKFESTQKKGRIIKKDIISDYVQHILNISKKLGLLNFETTRPSLVVDVGDGMGGLVVQKLSQKLDLKLSCLYCQPNGTFLHHSPNPLIAANLKDLQKVVLKKKADFGLAFDGDADRVIFVDEKGKIISGDMIIALFAKYFLKDFTPTRAKPSIVYNLTCSKAVQEIIKENGGQPIRTRTGHAFMKEAAKKHKAVFGGEISGHLYFQDNFYAECGGLTLLLMLKILAKAKKPLSALIKELKRYYRVGEINLEIKDREGAIKKLAKKYDDGKIDYLDGLTVQYQDWWFNVRPSNTEPLLRLVIEADTKELVEKRKEELLKLLK